VEHLWNIYGTFMERSGSIQGTVSEHLVNLLDPTIPLCAGVSELGVGVRAGHGVPHQQAL
jgi:hypothetical protein